MSDEKNTDELTDLFDSTGLSEEDEALAAEFADIDEDDDELLSLDDDDEEVSESTESAVEGDTTTEDLIASTTDTPSKFDKKFLDEFRSRLSPEQLQVVSTIAPKYAASMLEDQDLILSFGNKVIDEMSTFSKLLMKAQSKTRLPEVEKMVNQILIEMKGYKKFSGNNSKFGFLSKIGKKAQDVSEKANYKLETMEIKGMDLSKKLSKISTNLEKVEVGLVKNGVAGKKLSQKMIHCRNKLSMVIATMEEIIDLTRTQAQLLERTISQHEGEGRILYDGEYHTVEDLRLLLETYSSALVTMEKQWANWRAQYFFYTQSIKTGSILYVSNQEMRLTVKSLREKAIPVAINQIAQWQQAVMLESAAEQANIVDQGIKKLIQEGSDSTASAVESVVEMGNRQMLDEETINTLTKNIEKMHTAMSNAVKEGQQKRARVAVLMAEAEKKIDQSEREYQRKRIEDAIGTSMKSKAKVSKADAQSIDDILNEIR